MINNYPPKGGNVKISTCRGITETGRSIANHAEVFVVKFTFFIHRRFASETPDGTGVGHDRRNTIVTKE